MIPVDESELSGLLDGELDPERAAAVRRAIENDPALKAQFEQLTKLDGACRRSAEQAAFAPRVVMPTAPSSQAENSFQINSASVAAALIALVAIYFAPKMLSGLVVGMSLHVVALVVVLWIISRVARPKIAEA